ncbi:hypothetical protein H6F90_00320 [Trichocoleus sp. FACHB-591]|uniref:hypothetical protein n=1 Tax=Trichocoleus sp. FACHB-591 TaxID=2692872 RepID=UPI001683B185|nr:hypothetical protein [Trichocoleus sp. FACHB-591]MBD2093599.1 hypothetical protein [Trichocoleus sp. FACHB-591]
MFTENLSLLPSSQTQQSIREFQVRRPQSMRDKLAQYPGAYNDPALGRNRLGSMRVLRELKTLDAPSFPELVEGRLDLSPGYVKQVVGYSMLPDTTASNKKLDATQYRQWLTDPNFDPSKRRMTELALASAERQIDNLVAGNAAKMLNRQRYAGFQDPDGLRASQAFSEQYIGADPNPRNLSIGTAAAYQELAETNQALANLENRFGEGVDRHYLSRIDRDKMAGHLGLTQMQMLDLDPSQARSLGLREKPYRDLVRDDFESGFRPSMPHYSHGSDYKHSYGLDDLMDGVYASQRYSPGIKDIHDGDRYLDERKFTAAGKPLHYAASGEQTLGQLSRQAEADFGRRLTDTSSRLEIGNRDMPVSDQMVINDRNRQELVGEFEGSRRLTPRASEYLEPELPFSKLGANTYNYAPIKADSSGNHYRALSKTQYQNPLAEVESALKYQVLPLAGTTTTPYAARAKNDFIPDIGGATLPSRGTYGGGIEAAIMSAPRSILAQPLPMHPSRAEQIASANNQISMVSGIPRRNVETIRLGPTDLSFDASRSYHQDAQAGQSLTREAFARQFPDAIVQARATGLPVTQVLDRNYDAALKAGIAATTDATASPFNLTSPTERQALYRESNALDSLVAAHQIKDDVRSQVRPRDYGLVPIDAPANPNATLRAIAGRAQGQNLNAQQLEMGRTFTPTAELQTDPRVQALREKAIATQQEIDAGQELMAIRQQRQAERLAPAKVAASPFAQRQQMVVNDARMDSAIANLQARTNPKSKLGEVLSRVVGAGMMIR